MNNQRTSCLVTLKANIRASSLQLHTSSPSIRAVSASNDESEMNIHEEKQKNQDFLWIASHFMIKCWKVDYTYIYLALI